MCIFVSLHLHLLCVGLRAEAVVWEWMVHRMRVCQKEFFVFLRVCPNAWSILLRHRDWLVPTVTALTDSGGWPLTFTIPCIRLATLSPSSQLHIFSSLHILSFFFLSGARIKKGKQKPSQWLGMNSVPPCPHSPCLLSSHTEYICSEPCRAKRKQDVGLIKPSSLAWALPQHTPTPCRR